VLSLDRMRLVSLAVGVMMASEGLAEGDALARLRTRSQRSNCRLFETAVAVLTERQMSFR
jgi:AmiR/NasT family two-component response regulator